MEHTLSFHQLVRKTCFTIAIQFFLAILLLYLFPLFSMSLKVLGAPLLEKSRIEAIFFNAFSWMYLCLALIVIVTLNMKKMLKIVKKEMDAVYHHSMWLEPQQNSEKFTLTEFAETNDRIDKMQQQIKDMIENERKQKDDLLFKVAAASHDLKTPLTVIQGNSDLLLYSELNEAQKACLDDIVIACKKISTYFNALINYSKTFYDDKSEWKTYSTLDIVESVEQEAFYILKDKSILQLQNNIKEEKNVTLNLNYLLRAISNIIANADEYSRAEQKEIRLTISSEDEKLIFSIWNKGSYFSKEALANSDKLFYRDNKEREGNHSHFGIGLAFVKRIAQLHSGDLKIANVNDGAEITLTLKIN